LSLSWLEIRRHLADVLSMPAEPESGGFKDKIKACRLILPNVSAVWSGLTWARSPRLCCRAGMF
jgi:hypothetical protein